MFRWDDCLEGHMLLGFIFSIISFICLLLTTFSTPLIKTIYFVSVSSSSKSDSNTKFGTFGYCITQEIGQGGGASRCSHAKVGYTQPGGVGNGDELIEWLIKTSILFSIGESSLFLLLLFPSPLSNISSPRLTESSFFPIPLALLFMCFAIITLILSLLRVGKFMWNPIYFRTTALLGALLAILAAAFALILWVHARHVFDDVWEARYGAALWTGLVGTLCAALAAAIGGPAYQGQLMYRAHREVPYNL
ncbi:cytochrome C assembly protein [Cryptococcus neoformans Tu259-1]|uniref:Cytochrome C assembly protein n=1 Tax=Cryptococcus neoformans Tu259-1 TaxID=1230072 RepID=A0A854QAQ2_CRYNE|nr:cytochrome C assembly protein [Cryptococcus neoformans var. grubii Tu259-1]